MTKQPPSTARHRSGRTAVPKPARRGNKPVRSGSGTPVKPPSKRARAASERRQAILAAGLDEFTAKGFAGTVFLTTDDCMKAYEEMSARGVEFTEPPQRQLYGIDCGFRDPSGNTLRLTQPDTSFGK